MNRIEWLQGWFSFVRLLLASSFQGREVFVINTEIKTYAYKTRSELGRNEKNKSLEKEPKNLSLTPNGGCFCHPVPWQAGYVGGGQDCRKMAGEGSQSLWSLRAHFSGARRLFLISQTPGPLPGFHGHTGPAQAPCSSSKHRATPCGLRGKVFMGSEKHFHDAPDRRASKH